MVSVYFSLIINHRKTINDVPDSIRPQVIEKLISEGYDTEGNPIEKNQ